MVDGKYETILKDVQTFDKDSYLHSLLYYKITGRKGAWLYKDENSCLVVCQHPHETTALLVFCEIGRKTFDLTLAVLHELYRSNHKIKLARYSQTDFEKLQSRITKENFTILEDLQTVEEDQLDWLYPVHIYDTGIVSRMEGAAFNRIRAKYKKVEKLGVTHTPINKQTIIRDMRAALKYWEGSMIANNKETNCMAEFYERFFDLLEKSEISYDGLLYFQGRKPLGFVIWDEINATQANSFINLADTSITGLSDFQTVTTCKALIDKGIQYLNVGGSETQSLDDFKIKFQPIYSLPLSSIEVKYKDFKGTNIVMSKFV